MTQLTRNNNIDQLQDTVGYCFRNRDLLELALKHPSWSGEMKQSRIESNQRLEFLGDAVLELVISDFLYHAHKDTEEGQLTRMRSSMVFEEALCRCARSIGLGDYLYLGKGENMSGGREKPSILSDAFEALIGAIYLDGGFPEAARFIRRFVIGQIEELSLLRDGKSKIQEYIQSIGTDTIRYESVPVKSDELSSFASELYIGEKLISKGFGSTKKAAEQNAALEALKFYGIN